MWAARHHPQQVGLMKVVVVLYWFLREVCLGKGEEEGKTKFMFVMFFTEFVGDHALIFNYTSTKE